MDFDVVPSCKYIGHCYYSDNFSYFSVCVLKLDDQVYIQLTEKDWGSIALPANVFIAYLIAINSGLPTPTEDIKGYYIVSSRNFHNNHQGVDEVLSCKLVLTRKYGENLKIQLRESFFDWYINSSYIQEILEFLKDPTALIVGE